NVLGRLGAQDHQVGFHILRDAAVTVRISEPSRWICSERRENLLIVHAGLRHESEFKRSVVVIGIADVGSKQNIAARLSARTQLVNHLSNESSALLVGRA